MPDLLTQAPLAQRRRFCDMLLADRVGTWAFWKDLIIVARDDRPVCVIDALGGVTELALETEASRGKLLAFEGGRRG